ncbi:glutamate--cysteine ligase [Inhella gelatinilytica]|uniref:Glutamate--cysteine ligase n=1 Tax=Inhella gelatinilytica TaxID=2795030 RepID=A0A931IY83_9BURK|nr:glutamate--cysteine ligase [Inhella gelatinilytica]MBH9554364.1 glutamate--cysteine ligase [Inhella gelatinilytica]
MTLTADLRGLTPERLRGMRRGIERESLRVQPSHALALTPHPIALGAALTHPHITTDFSESQVELITGVHARAEDCIQELAELHQFVYRALGDERLWVNSMPCCLPVDESIPIGRYGSSHIGRAKAVYRAGLGHRYGRRMQMISGIHYNWSLPGLDNAAYFGLIRNFRRHSFVLLTLFGASPAVCSSFVEGREHGLQALSATQPGALILPHATSLRMGRLGYQSDAQSRLAVSYNCLDRYAESLQAALTEPYGPYERIGLRNLGGEYNQLSTSLLQIENEFYGTIRPKRVIRSGERPLHALRERGVEYVEVRCMDLNPFEDVGIGADTLRVLDLFLLHCLHTDSPPDSPEEIAAIARNQQLTATRGREVGLMLERGGQAVSLMTWAGEILTACEPLAQAVDAALGGEAYQQALAQAQQALRQPEGLPSARVLAATRTEDSFIRATGQMSDAIRERLLAQPLAPEVQQRLLLEAAASIAEQARVEAADTEPFEVFRQRYLDPHTLVC